LREEWAKEHVKDLSNKQKAKKEAREIDKVLFQWLSLIIKSDTF
jgi:amino-acid N-acetyltransferase